jgi:peptide/nickel transport system substrate-binding protein
VAPNAKDNDFGNDWLKMHSAGSGALKCASISRIRPSCWRPTPAPTGAPKLKSIIIKNVPDPASRRLLIQQGDADVARDLGADQIAALQDKPGVKVLSIPSAEQNYLVFNTGNSANPLLNNPAFWEAARWLVDYDGITKNLLKGQYFIHQSFLPVGLPGALETNPFTFDPQKLKLSSPKRALRMRTSPRRGEQTAVYHHRPVAAGQLCPGRREGGSAARRRQPGLCPVRAKQHQAAIRLWIPDYLMPTPTPAPLRGTMVNPAPWPGSTAGRSLS